jgi:chaperone modulatory protein CbpM
MATTAPTRTKLRIVRRRTTGPDVPVGLDVLARESGLHPEVVRRLVRLGLVEPAGWSGGAPLFPRDAAARLARAARLRRDLGLGYAGAVLASELLERIDVLEARLRRYEPLPDKREVTAWTRTS